MGTQQAVAVKVNDITVCSICFEKFKTPRYLPCKHSFCHDCLCSYIVRQCKSTEPRLGFNCPLCRQYTVSDGETEKPEKWAEYFPVNSVLEKMVYQSGNKYCELCLKENEKEPASNYCLTCKEYLCAMCTKFHMKFRAMKDHKTVSLSETESVQIVSTLEVENPCPVHCNEEIQLYCVEHEKPCCWICAETTHQKCENFTMVKKTGQLLVERGNIDSLLEAANAFKDKLICVKTKTEKNITEIQDMEDEKRSDFKVDFRCLMQDLEKLKRECLDEISSTSKEGREKLQREIVRLEEGVMCLNSCIQDLQMAKGTSNEKERVMKFSKAKETFRKLKKCNLKDTHLKFDIVFRKGIRDLQKIASVSLMEFPHLIDFDVENLELTVFKRFTIKRGKIKSGLVLSGGDFLLVNELEETCLVYDEQWKCYHTIQCLSKPHDVTQNEEGIFVTNPEAKQIQVFSSPNSIKEGKSQRLRSIPVSYVVKGIACFEENMFVSCPDTILKIDNKGEITKFCENKTDTYDIAATKSGLILCIQSTAFKRYTSREVVAMTSEGKKAWNYKNYLQNDPRCLDVDSRDHIYVAYTLSNTVHILSNDGALIREIKNIPEPLFFKVNEARGTVCVGSAKNEMMIYTF